MIGRTPETVFNAALAAALERRHPRWTAEAERSDVVRGHKGLRPDLLIRPHRGGAGEIVLIETEFEPAATVEADARKRLGLVIDDAGQTIRQVVALRMPAGLRSLGSAEIESEIGSAEFEYRLVRSDGADQEVWFPGSGWLTGNVDDLAGFVERIALNEHLLNEVVDEFETSVNAVANGLRQRLETYHSAALRGIARALHQEDGPQTTRMGVAIIANALLFQTAIGQTSHNGYEVPLPDPKLSRLEVLAEWDRILSVNYYPIFYTAKDMLAPIPDGPAKGVIDSLTDIASRLAGYGVTSTGDMAGQMFGRLITDRKFLATFYTLPSSAHLLAELAVARLRTDWSDAEQAAELRVADLACGTGTLLTAAYQRMTARVRRAGSDDAALHPPAMERSLIGADIMPAAVHLTATLLSSTHPATPFSDTRVALMPYGDDGEGTGPKLGSLELLDSDFAAPLPFGSVRRRVGGSDEIVDHVVLDHGEADLVIMNPPFTRPTNHEAHAADVRVPSFAGFNTSDAEQQAMARRLKKLVGALKKADSKSRNPCGVAGHGNVGLGSNFLDVAHAKVKPGGTIAFVLPFTVMSGKDWSKARSLLAAGYRDICVVAIAATGANDRSFSADTGMAEVLIVATRRQPDDTSDAGGVLYVNLTGRPDNLVDGVEAARCVNMIPRTEPKGFLTVGDSRIGSFIRAGLDDGGCAGIVEPDLVACGLAVTEGRLCLPQLGTIADIPVARLGELGERGPYHLDIRGRPPRGPFDVVALGRDEDWRTATYPMLWAHDADKERRFFVEPDTQGRVRPGLSDKARRIWDSAAQLHFNSDFQLNSQPLAACLTPARSIGGRAWPAFRLSDPRWEKLMVLWANSTLGLLSFWWTGTRQQQGRANLTIARLPELPVLDPRSLDDQQLETAAEIFDWLSERDFLPANEAYRDEARRQLDHALLVELLAAGGFSAASRVDVPAAVDVLRRQWCAEPSVHGGKSTRYGQAMAEAGT